jgi:excisionase family DNA binding protein
VNAGSDFLPASYQKVEHRTAMLAHTQPIIQPQAMKLKQAAEYLAVSPVTVRRLVAAGRLKRHPAIRHIVIPRASLDQFLAEVEL